MLVSKCNAAADGLRTVLVWLDGRQRLIDTAIGRAENDAIMVRLRTAEKALRQAAGYLEEVDGPGESLAFNGDVAAALDLLDSQREPDDGSTRPSPAPGA